MIIEMTDIRVEGVKKTEEIRKLIKTTEDPYSTKTIEKDIEIKSATIIGNIITNNDLDDQSIECLVSFFTSLIKIIDTRDQSIKSLKYELSDRDLTINDLKNEITRKQ